MKRFARRERCSGARWPSRHRAACLHLWTSGPPPAPPSPVTPEMIAAAKKEGRVVYYTSDSICPLRSRIAKAFEARYPGIDGAPWSAPAGRARIPAYWPREYASRIHLGRCPSIRLTPPTFVVWKRERDARGVRARGRCQILSRRAQRPRWHLREAFAFWPVRFIAYNTTHGSSRGKAPKELRRPCLDPKWTGKIGQSASELQRHQS